MAAFRLRVRSLIQVCWPGELPQHCTRLIYLCLHNLRVLPASVPRRLFAAQ